MTEQQEKAEDLVRDMEFQIPYVHDPTEPQANEIAKQCALIAVDEILKSHNNLYGVNSEKTKFYLEVKQEIEKL